MRKFNYGKANDTSKFNENAIVYSHKLGEYLQIKKREVETKDEKEEVVSLKCKVTKAKDVIANDNAEVQAGAEITVSPKDVSKFIYIKVSI